MINSWKVLATFLLCNLAMAAWAAGSELERREIPLGAKGNGLLLNVRGVFEVKELAGQLIVLYQDPVNGSFGYSLQEGPTNGEDVLDFGDVKLAVTFAGGGGLRSVEVLENGTWSTVGELGAKEIKGKLGAKAAKKGPHPLPDFDQVAKAPEPCEGGEYEFSVWHNGCLLDFFYCSKSFKGEEACCDEPPNGSNTPDCQDHGVPEPKANL